MAFRSAASAFLVSAAFTRPLTAQQQPGVGTIPIAIESRLADAAHLRVGDSVRLVGITPAGTPAIIAAIYAPRPDPATIMRQDYHVRLHLGDLAALLGQPDQVDRIGIVLQPGRNADSAAAHLNRVAFGYDVVPSRQLAAESSTTFLVVSRFHRAIAIISILASAIFLLCLMLMKVDERRRDVAVLRFTGISRRTIFGALVCEAALIALLGSFAGAVMASGASEVVNRYYRHFYQTTLMFSEITRSTLLLAVGLSVALGIAAGVVAAWRLVMTRPVELWRRAA